MPKLHLSLCLFAVSVLIACGAGAPEAETAPAERGDYLAFFGVYTRGEAQGVYVSRFDHETGELGEPALAAEIENPSFLALHPNQQYLYAVSEMAQDGTVSAFSIERPSGKLTLLNTLPTNGGLPCDLEVDQTSKMLTVANYGTGSVISYPINPDGSLGESTDFQQHEGSSVNEQRQQGPHAHSVDFSADNRFLVVSDLGIDKVMVYEADPESATLKAHDPASVDINPGGGPRHFAFHPTLPYAYTNNELTSAVTALEWNAAAGTLSEIETVSTLPEGFEGNNSTAELEIHPSGKFLYCSNRGHNSLAVYSIDQETGKLTKVENASTQGEIPRNFAIAPGGEFLLAANQNTANVVAFSIDQQTGKLTPTGAEITVDMPVCIKYTPVNAD